MTERLSEKLGGAAGYRLESGFVFKYMNLEVELSGAGHRRVESVMFSQRRGYL